MSEEDRAALAAEVAGMVRRFDSLARYYAAVRLECFNREEADAMVSEFKRLRPDVPVNASWYTFEGGR